MNNTKIESVECGWEAAVVMVCTKCGKQFSDSYSEEAPERIKSELKAKARIEFGKSVRVITTSCLNICPINKIAIVKASKSEPAVFKAYAVDPDTTDVELYKTLFKNEI